MKLEYNFTSKDLKEYLKYKRRTINLIYLVISTILYFWINFYMIIKNPVTVISGYLILVVVLIVMMFLVNYIYFLIIYNKNKGLLGKYTLEYNKSNLTSSVNGITNKYQYKDIKRIKKTKNYFVININNISLVLLKSFFNNNDFNKCYDSISKFVV